MHAAAAALGTLNLWTNQRIACFLCCLKLLLQPSWNLIKILNIFKATWFCAVWKSLRWFNRFCTTLNDLLNPNKIMLKSKHTQHFCVKCHFFLSNKNRLQNRIQLYCNFQNKLSKRLINDHLTANDHFHYLYILPTAFQRVCLSLLLMFLFLSFFGIICRKSNNLTESFLATLKFLWRHKFIILYFYWSGNHFIFTHWFELNFEEEKYKYRFLEMMRSKACTVKAMMKLRWVDQFLLPKKKETKENID